jgi:hypothetical protein
MTWMLWNAVILPDSKLINGSGLLDGDSPSLNALFNTVCQL